MKSEKRHILLTEYIAYNCDDGILKIKPQGIEKLKEETGEYEEIIKLEEHILKESDDEDIEKIYEITQNLGQRLKQNKPFDDIKEIEITEKIIPKEDEGKEIKEIETFNRIENIGKKENLFRLGNYKQENASIIINPNELAKAMAYRKNKKTENTIKYARKVMDIFGYEDVAIDNKLGAEERKILYKLERDGIVKKENIEVKLGCLPKDPYSLKKWTAYFWLIEKSKIQDYAKKYDKKDTIKNNESVYKSEEIWKRGKNN